MTKPAKAALKRWRRFAQVHAALALDGAAPEVLAEHRRSATRDDPVLFALVYLSKHLVDKATDEVGLADVHIAWAQSAKRWRRRNTAPMQDRRVEVAPREMGKSTWWFLLLPLWAAAHDWVKFAAAFADSDTQAQTHLATFKSELDNNALIRFDYPKLVSPKTRGRGQTQADRVSLYHAKSDFVFAAAGADSRNLGLKVDDKRPDLLIIDDIEPHESQYSADLAVKRLDTLLNAILPLNIYAHVIIAGTVTMQGSIIHQLVKAGRGEVDEANTWVSEQQFEVRHTHAIVLDDDGRRRSVWPAKWPLSWLETIEGSAGYAKNYDNDPLGASGSYWVLEDIDRARALGVVAGITRKLVSVDPAVTSKRKSDYSGISVLGWSPSLNKVTVLECRQVRKGGAELRLDVLDTLMRHNAGLVLVETNQGGDLWRTVLWGLSVKVKTLHQTESKEVRAAEALDHYQRNRVGHAPDFVSAGVKYSLKDAEGQLVAFPKAPHDDMVDTITSGVLYFLKPRKRVKVGGENQPYAN